ncbi:E3 ubiquitin-protein ligase TRIM33-like isoform X2 [Acanthaster planci]|nr:E3 ubiquitin-protein ligase TRIM33-like isoform X2 [Acanthaster planci]
MSHTCTQEPSESIRLCDMASNVTVQSVLSKISQDHLECSICSCRFKEPKVLDCLHSFCLKCLQQLSQGQGSGSTKLTCPLCRHDTKLKGNDVAALPNNFALGALVEEFTIQEQLSGVQLGSEIKCQACEEENPAISRCMDCDSFLCQECKTLHGRLAMLKSHSIRTLDELSSGKNVYKSKLRETPKCARHPDQIVSMYCNTCETVVCTTCYALHHAKHSLTDLSEASGKCKQDIAEMMAKAEKIQKTWRTAEKKVAGTREKLGNMYFDATAKISEKADKEVARIRQEERKLKEEVEKVYKEKLQKLTTAEATCSKERSQTAQKLDDVNRLVARASSCEILNLKEKLFQNLQELSSKKPPAVTKQAAFHFEEGEEVSLGKLVLDAKSKPKLQAQDEENPLQGPEQPYLSKTWDLKTERKNFDSARDVAVCSNNDIIVVEAKATQHHLKTFVPVSKSEAKLQGTVPSKATILQIKGLKNPSQVKVDKNDQITILDRKVVKTFNRDYQLLRFFEATDDLSRPPSCLAVDDNVIALGYERKGEISLHNPYGTLIKTLPAPGISDNMTLSNQHLIYTNRKQKQVVSVDYKGSVVFSAEIPSQASQQCELSDVCCDDQGYIFVAAFINNERAEIHHFSPDGKHLGRVIRGQYLIKGITFSPCCTMLVVAAGNSVKIYHQT